MNLRLRLDLLQGAEVPRWYGIAWRDYNRDVAVCYVIPLHLLLAWPRAAWYWLRFSATPWRSLSRVRYDAYRRGIEGRPFDG